MRRIANFAVILACGIFLAILAAPALRADDISSSPPLRAVPQEIRDQWSPLKSGLPVIFGQLSPKTWFMLQAAPGPRPRVVKSWLHYDNVTDGRNFSGWLNNAVISDNNVIVFNGILSRPSGVAAGKIVEVPAKLTISLQNADLNFKPGFDAVASVRLQAGDRDYVLHNANLHKVQ